MVSTQRHRIFFLDNLRTFIIFLVILYHAGGVYESSGYWADFWIVDDPATNELAGLLNIFLDVLVMPTIFLVSGYVTPASFEKRSGAKFLADKARRLMLPWLVAVLTLVPMYYMIFLYSRGLPQADWTAYFHISRQSVTGQGWLWFLPVLFLFNILYLGLARAGLLAFDMSVRTAIVVVFVVGFLSLFVVDVLGGAGWFLSPLIDFQKERLLLYFAVFLLGAHMFRHDVFAGPPGGSRWYMINSVLVWVPVMIYGTMVVFPFVSDAPALFSPVGDMLVKWIGFCLTLALLMYLVIETFRRYFNQTNAFWRVANRNSYYVYILHMVVLGGVATLLLNMSLPSMVKYPLAALATFIISNLIVPIGRGVSNRPSGQVATG